LLIRILIGLSLIFLISGCGGNSLSTGTASPDPGIQGTEKSSPSNISKRLDSDLDLRFGTSINNYIRNSWGTWANGDAIGQCFIANTEKMTHESKEGVIEYGIEEAFGKLTGEHLYSLSATWDLCESEAASNPVSSKNQPLKKAEPKASNPTPTSMVDFESTSVYKPFSAELETQFRDAIDDRFYEYTEKAGISAAVYKNGYLWKYANGDASSSAPMTVGTPTLIRSSSKSFIAGLVLKQIDDGLYSLSDTLDKILSDNDVYKTLDKSVINPMVTIEELLNMTSGIQEKKEYGDDEEYNDAFNALQINQNWEPVDSLQLATVKFKTPGQYEYSNTNTLLLGVIAEHAGGQNLNKLYKTELFDPFDVVALLLPRDDAPTSTSRPHGEGWSGTGFGDILASSYLQDEWYLATGRTTWNAAGIITTPENMARWAYELFSAEGSVLSSKARATLLESFTGPLIQIGAADQQYGYHSTKREISLSNMTIFAYGHPGSGGGYTSEFYYSPELDLSLSIQLNSHTNARTREAAQGAATHSDLNEIAWQIFDAYATQ
jgi:D-alanyl-D-alanine carboxypeptidase